MLADGMNARMALFKDLLGDMPVSSQLAEMVIKGVSADSRNVQAGSLYLACFGRNHHGLDFIDQVVDAGAVAVLAEMKGEWDGDRIRKMDDSWPIPIIPVAGLSRKVGDIAARFYGHPSQSMRVIGITGTNGKTSVAHFLAQCLNKYYTMAVVGTNGNGFLPNLETSTHTTPDAVNLQALLSKLDAQGARGVAMEVSSHALDQSRVNGLLFHTAVFTNLTPEHLDYHQTMQAYGDAKARLFRMDGLMWAVINGDDERGATLLAELTDKVDTVACGSSKAVERMGDFYIRVERVLADTSGLTVRFDSSWGEGQFSASVLGEFNVDNLILTLGVMLAWGLDFKASVAALKECRSVDGRMDVTGGGENPHVVVDFAHTPDALEKALSSLRHHVSGKLVCVFGCGGDRDQGKRPQMGEIASRLADRVVLTDDNPRGENPAEIIAAIREGMTHEVPVEIEHDRASAIRMAIERAGAEDWVLIAGKGHENSQITGDLTLAFNDMEQVQRVLRELAA